MLKEFCLLLVLVQFAFGALDIHEITSLPGLKHQLPSRQYSGYLPVGDSNLHYWFVFSENDPSNDPVVLWLNGGPGCSSLDGFFYELGPFEITPSLGLNLRPYRWNRFANMLFLEAPVGVGFSYSSTKDYNNSDDRTANENRQALEKFYSYFPEFKSNPLYITGESYAGIYVPTLAESILQAADAGIYTGADLKGIAVGNGCTGTEIGVCGWYFNGICQGMYQSMKYLLDLPFFSKDLKQSIDAACNWDMCKNNFTANSYLNALSEQCLNLLDDASIALGEINIYNVYGTCIFDSCAGPGGNGRVGALNVHVEKFNNMKLQLQMNIQQMKQQDSSPPHHKPIGIGHDFKIKSIDVNNTDDLPRGPAGCIDSGLATRYLMQTSVQEAIHVKDPGYCWAVCNQAPGFTYTPTRSNLPRDTYPFLISRLKVLIYNGDWDACVPYTDNAAWTESLGLTPLSPWKTWFYRALDNSTQIGGYSVVYDTASLAVSSKSSFEFRTVRGAGHMVPTDTPIQGLAVLSKLLGVSEVHQYSASTNNNDDTIETVYNCPMPKHSRVPFVVGFIAFIVAAGVILFQAKEMKRMRSQLAGNSGNSMSSDVGINMIHNPSSRSQAGTNASDAGGLPHGSSIGANTAYLPVKLHNTDEDSVHSP